MGTAGAQPLYRHTGVALLRSAVRGSTDAPDWWPEPDDPQSSRSWLQRTWSEPGFADAVGQASPTLAHRVETICAGQPVEPKQIRRATVATAGYLLRALGRPTPFGLFAGVAPVRLGCTARVRRDSGHRPMARVDTQWLAAVIDRLEAYPDLLERLDVAFNNLAVRRGSRLEAPCGPGRVQVRYTGAVQAAQDAATAAPVRFGALVDKLAETFGAERPAVAGMLTELVRRGFLITCLRAPLTTTDPLTHLLDRLAEVGAGTLASAVALLRDLATVRDEVSSLNNGIRNRREQEVTHASISNRMRQISTAGRIPLAVDLLLDCEVQLPEHVVQEMARAATALLRLTRQPAGWPAWRDYHAVFCDRYGTGTLVPVTDVVDPDAGLGYPAGYPGSVLPMPVEGPSPRDERLLALAWQTVMEGSCEIVLTDETIQAVAGDERLDTRWIPPHVELAARIHATSVEALTRGEYSLTVAPARAGGTLTSRFTPTTTGAGLEAVYRDLPMSIEGALPVQMSFPPAYPHAENVCRIPAYLPHVLSLGEHLGAGHYGSDDGATVPLDDLAVTATRERLHLVSISHRQVIEPQVFHALALDKQPPPLARFLAHLPRAYSAAWTVLDWGPSAEQLPYLPRVRYGRCILAPARWRLTADALPRAEAGSDVWRTAVEAWLRRLGCPSTMELRDDDRSLRLDLDQPIHAAILHAHLARHGHATLTDAARPAGYGWFDGRAHEIAVPLVRTGAPAPSPLAGALPLVTNSGHGQWPGEPDARWLSLRIHTHPERHDEIIAKRLPELATSLGGKAGCWFVRYRSPHQTDHLRLRLPTAGREQSGAQVVVIGDWARRMRRDGLIGCVAFDSYQPEVGRYGVGRALEAAEQVFVADSRAVSAQLRHLPASVIQPVVLAVASMVDIVRGFLGPEDAMRWLAAHPVASAGTAAGRALADESVRQALSGAPADLPGFTGEVDQAWHARTAALVAYRAEVPGVDTDSVLESLLHMHYNRAIGIDADGEHVCRRLAYQAARAWQARQARRAEDDE